MRLESLPDLSLVSGVYESTLVDGRPVLCESTDVWGRKAWVVDAGLDFFEAVGGRVKLGRLVEGIGSKASGWVMWSPDRPDFWSPLHSLLLSAFSERDGDAFVVFDSWEVDDFLVPPEVVAEFLAVTSPHVPSAVASDEQRRLRVIGALSRSVWEKDRHLVGLRRRGRSDSDAEVVETLESLQSARSRLAGFGFSTRQVEFLASLVGRNMIRRVWLDSVRRAVELTEAIFED